MKYVATGAFLILQLVTGGKVKIKRDVLLFADHGKRKIAVEILGSYDPRYLRVGLEVLHNQVFSIVNDDFLKSFLTEVDQYEFMC